VLASAFHQSDTIIPQSDIFVTLESCIEMQIQDSEKLLEILLIRVKLLRRWVLLFGEILWLLKDIAVW
jgi:hypothetical protein